MIIGRREFIKTAAAAFGGAALALRADPITEEAGYVHAPFKMKFAPRLTMDLFRASAGKGLLERTQWFYDKGFRAVEGAVFFDHNKQDESKIKEQAALGELVKSLGMEMGCISSMNEKHHPIMTANYAPDKKIFDRQAVRDFLLWQMDGTFEVMRRLGSKTFIIGAGAKAKDVSDAQQYENVVENMRFCAEYCLQNGMVMEIEPLNEKSHPGIYFTTASLGAKVCNDVNMPSCRLLYDIFHEHMQVGNNDALDNGEVFKHILSFHMADAPGRNEPGTGLIDYESILKKIASKGFTGIFGLEHGQTDKTKEGDKKLLQIYRKLDSAVL